MKAREMFAEGIEISKKLLSPVFLIAIIMLTVALGLYVFRCIPTYTATAVKYDVLRDILGIFFVTIGIASVGIFWVLKRLIRESVVKDIDMKFSNIIGKQAIFHGYTYWLNKDVDEAIKLTKIALNKNLEEIDKIWAKNNLAYYYADKHSKEPQWDLRDIVMEYAEYVYRKYDRYSEDYNNPVWVETYAFVKTKFSQKDEEIEYTEKEIRELMERKDLEEIKGDLQESLDYLREKTKNGEEPGSEDPLA